MTELQGAAGDSGGAGKGVGGGEGERAEAKLGEALDAAEHAGMGEDAAGGVGGVEAKG